MTASLRAYEIWSYVECVPILYCSCVCVCVISVPFNLTDLWLWEEVAWRVLFRSVESVFFGSCKKKIWEYLFTSLTFSYSKKGWSASRDTPSDTFTILLHTPSSSFKPPCPPLVSQAASQGTIATLHLQTLTAWQAQIRCQLHLLGWLVCR